MYRRIEELVAKHILVEKPCNVVPVTFEAVRRPLDWIANTALDIEGIFRISAPAPESNAVLQTLVSGGMGALPLLFSEPCHRHEL